MHTTCYTETDIWRLLENVCDPEVPVLSVVDLGIIRHVAVSDRYGGQQVQVTITPTYSGCPAMDMIAANIRMELLMAGMATVDIIYQLAPAWTTDWMSEAGRQKLSAYGIAPPVHKANTCGPMELEGDFIVPCPHCGSEQTEMVSYFGSTACKALYRCTCCREPFDYFKCH